MEFYIHHYCTLLNQRHTVITCPVEDTMFFLRYRIRFLVVNDESGDIQSPVISRQKDTPNPITDKSISSDTKHGLQNLIFLLNQMNAHVSKKELLMKNKASKKKM